MTGTRKARILSRLVSCSFVIVLSCSTATAAPAKPNPIHLNGKRAETLISLLVSGSDQIAKSFEISAEHQVVLRDVEVEAIETYKYEPDTWFYKLPEYRASAKIGNDNSQTSIGEATSLWRFFLGVGLESDLAMDGSYLQIRQINCKVNVHADMSSPNRFQCDLTLPD
jgi:hypothetical protein